MKRIPLRRRDGSVRAYTLVDDADYGWLSKWRWCCSAGYAMRGGEGSVLMHRQILGLAAGDPRQGDHRNRDRLDNRKANLRIAARGDADNQQNLGLRSDNTSGYRGVVRHKGKWEAFAKLDGRRLYLGLYTTPAEADVAVKAWRAKHMPFSEDAASVAPASVAA